MAATSFVARSRGDRDGSCHEKESWGIGAHLQRSSRGPIVDRFRSIATRARSASGSARPDPAGAAPGVGGRGRGRLSLVPAIALVFAIGWAAFWIYWLVAAFSMKRGRVPWGRELRIRAL